MGERVRSADPQTIEVAIRRMAGGVQNLSDLVSQLQASIDASKRIGMDPSVSIFQGAQIAGGNELRKFQDELNCLTVGGRRFDIIAELAKTARGGTGIDS